MIKQSYLYIYARPPLHEPPLSNDFLIRSFQLLLRPYSPILLGHLAKTRRKNELLIYKWTLYIKTEKTKPYLIADKKIFNYLVKIF